MVLVLLAIAAWRVMHFIQQDSLFEPVREWFYLRFPVDDWYTLQRDDDVLIGDGELEEKVYLTRGRITREVNVTWDEDGYEYYFPTKRSKLGELVSCLWCLSIWIAAVATFIYYSFHPGTIILDQLVHWLVVASGIVVIEKLVDRI